MRCNNAHFLLACGQIKESQTAVAHPYLEKLVVKRHFCREEVEM